jgi:protein-S-isoprenylcysteine O-methyltransferase Ste14
MKKTVLTYGLLSGAITAVIWTIICSFGSEKTLQGGMVVGYAAQILAFILVYFGMASYKNNVMGGRISFGKALQVGSLISLVSIICYIIAWAIIYKTLVPDFMDKYIAYEIDSAKKTGISATELSKKIADLEQNKVNYRNPLYFILFTFIETLPVAIIVTFVSAFVVRTKNKTVPVNS